MIPPLRGVFEGLAPSVSFFGSKEECQPENAFEAANGYIRYENNYSNNDFLFFFFMREWGQGGRERVPVSHCFGSFAISQHLRG